jgi:hypothetical protein
MKLPNFREHNWMNNLRNIIWANLNYDYNPLSTWDPLMLKLINEWELDWLKLSDVSISNDWTLEYWWIKVVVYIRDQNSLWFNFKTWKSNYKFHFYNCATISAYRREWKYDWKYVVNRHKKFNVNLIDFWRIIKTNLELDLNVCKWCLQSFHYKWYHNHWWILENKIYNEFNREEYFKSFKSKVSIPKHNHISKPMDIYPDNWNKISRKAKERVWYKCEWCWAQNKILHLHHKDHNKWNNSINNLEVLCYDCHTKHHSHM